MTTRFDEKDRKKIEDAKTLISIILLFITSILGAGILSALADFHQHLWFWGIK